MYGMHTNRFTLSLVFRIFLLLINMILISTVIREPVENQMVFTLISLFIILLLQVIMLYEFLNRTNQNLLRFFMIIFDSDYSTHFQEKVKSSPFIELNRAFNRVIDTYKDLSREKELHYLYLDEVVKHIKVGIISVNESGKIGIMNHPASDLLQVIKCASWSDLKEAQPSFTSQIEKITRSGSSIIKLDLPYGKRNLSVHISRLKLQDESWRLITLQDVQEEIEQGEIEATHKLIRILNHEIMNSITPINSLTETVSMILQNENGIHKELSELTEMNLSDIRESVASIRERTEGLDHFLNGYQKLSQLPKLVKPKRIRLTDLFDGIGRLMQGELQKKQVILERDIPDEEIYVTADPHLLEQVIINLISNSIDALSGVQKPVIRFCAKMEGNHSVIEIKDNGKGILPEQLEQIFVPFYSTKQEGNGIGLSFSRQIMKLHGGSISVKSEPGVETVFTLKF
jgi:two-component system, NtrC family, nitrogen regulation sensor histidine kinase NtrY